MVDTLRVVNPNECQPKMPDSSATTIPGLLLTPALGHPNDESLSDDATKFFIDDMPKSVMLLSFMDVVTKACGVQKYLQHELLFLFEQKAFVTYLDAVLPELQDIHYTTTGPVPYVWDGEGQCYSSMRMRLKWFAYEAFASWQAEPEVASSRQLMDRFLTEGFITVSEPIITSTHIDTPGPLQPFTMHCVKGVTRTLTVMAFFCWCFKNDVLPPDILVKTCCTIYVRNVNFVDAGPAHRGGIRRTPHLVSWVQTLKKLQKEDCTLTPTELIKRWNDKATQSFMGSDLEEDTK